MAKVLWGKVYYQEKYVGRLEERPGGQIIFTYDETYLASNQPAIAYTLPLSARPYISERGLHPFFDNLVAEGWLKNAQARALKVDPNNRFALLLGFGQDLAGAVSIIDPDAEAYHTLNHSDPATVAALLGRASLSGIQRKLLVIKDGQQFRPVRVQELSTHIAKLVSGNLNELLELEYLTTQAVQALLPSDDMVIMHITTIPSIHEEALIVPRFDRTVTGKKLHFEEFNQLLGHASGDEKYDGAYEDMGQFILHTPHCIPTEAMRLLYRILACLLVGNTDAHFKNFAMFHTRDGLRLTPAYDLVASSVYKNFQSIALDIAGIRNLAIGRLMSKHLLKMGAGFGAHSDIILGFVKKLESRIPHAQTTVEKSNIGSKRLKEALQKKMEQRWNGSFASIGQHWLKKQN